MMIHATATFESRDWRPSVIDAGPLGVRPQHLHAFAFIRRAAARLKYDEVMRKFQRQSGAVHGHTIAAPRLRGNNGIGTNSTISQPLLSTDATCPNTKMKTAADSDPRRRDSPTRGVEDRRS
jgi:hypothetical protein